MIAAPADGPRRPNILVFMSDQQGGSTLVDGRARAITPRLDELRARATRFERAYAPAPHCCPSRASFFTSAYPSQHGVWNNVNVANALSRGPRPGVQFWSRDLADAGYELAFAGKWHVSNEHGPSHYGWRELVVFPETPGIGRSLEQQHTDARARDLERNSVMHESAEDRAPGQIERAGWPRYLHYGIDEDPFRDRAVVARAVEFVEEEHDHPWALYVGTLGPHDPYLVPQRFLDWYDLDDIELPASFHDPFDAVPGLYRRARRPFDQLSEHEHREALRHYLAFCSYEDHLFGQLLDALEATGSDRDTIVVYTSDHGDYMGEHGLWTKGLPSYTAAYHVPLVIAAPGCPGGTAEQAPATLLDVGPTLLDLAGVEGASPYAGASMAPVVRGGSVGERDLFFQSNGNESYGMQRSVIHGSWKLVHNLFDEDELYDLETDPHELHNLLHVAPAERRVGISPLADVPSELHAIVLDLYRRLWRFAIDHDDDISQDYPLTSFAPFGPAIVHARD